MTPMNEGSRRTLRQALLVVGLGCWAGGAAHADAALLERVRFYWQYAPLAAHVYDSKGENDSRVGMALASKWLRDELAASPLDVAARQRFEAMGQHGLPALQAELQAACESAALPSSDSASAAGAAQPSDDCRAAAEEARQLAEARRKEPNRFDNATPRSDEDCEIRDDRDPAVPVDEAMRELQWERVSEFQRAGPVRSWSVFVPHLAIDVWRRPHPRADGHAGRSVEYAVVYRGTVGGGGWVSNLRALTAITPFVWDQYRQARQATVEIVRQIDQLHDISDKLFQRPPEQRTRVYITAVGHSLGAGLASFVYLSNKRVSRVVGFDPSPVDGSRMVALDDRPKVDADKPLIDRDPRHPQASIFLLYERGEILSRIAACASGPMWGSGGGPQVLCENVNFSRGSWFDQHSMSQLACKLYLRRGQLSRNVEPSSQTVAPAP